MATRVQAREFLESLGVAEVTEEMVTNYLNNMNGELAKEKAKTEAYKKDADKAAELQKALDDLNNANLSDIDKANKATEAANNKIADLEKQIADMRTKNSLISQGLSEEEAEKFVESMASGSFDASILGSIIADRQKTAISEYEKQALRDTPNPNGGSEGVNLPKDKPDAENKIDADKLAESYAKSLSASDKNAADIVGAYI